MARIELLVICFTGPKDMSSRYISHFCQYRLAETPRTHNPSKIRLFSLQNRLSRAYINAYVRSIQGS
jgi:hypothetical protein